MTNNYFGEDKIVDAALSLVRLVNLHGKPVVFNMDRYMEIVSGVTRPRLTLDSELQFSEPEGKFTEAQVAALDADILRYQKRGPKAKAQRDSFVKTLSDAFSLSSVCKVGNCVLTEIGHTDEYEALGEGWIFAVFPIPTMDNCFVVDL